MTCKSNYCLAGLFMLILFSGILPLQGFCQQPVDNTIRFKANGAPVKTSAWNIAPFTGTNGIAGINVSSNMHEDRRTVGFNINGNTAGVYPFKVGFRATGTKGIAYGSYHPDYLKVITENYRFVSGEFVITSIDSQKHLFNGSFHGTARNAKGQEIEITDGVVINGVLKQAAVSSAH